MGTQIQPLIQERIVEISPVKQGFTTKDLWDCFHEVGEIEAIRIGDGRRSAEIIFSLIHKPEVIKQRRRRVSHPKNGSQPLNFNLNVKRVISRLYDTPTGHHMATQRVLIKAQSLSIGAQTGPVNFNTFRTIVGQARFPIVVSHDYRFRELQITFPLAITGSKAQNYKVNIQHANLQTVWEIATTEEGSTLATLVISLENVPEFFIKQDDQACHVPAANHWNSRSAWYRKTNVPYDTDYIEGVATMLWRPRSLVNIGRWRTYCLTFDVSIPNQKTAYDLLYKRLEDFNVSIQQRTDLKVSAVEDEPVWSMLAKGQVSKGQTNSLSFLAELQDESVFYLSFDIRYQLEVCISEGSLSEYSIPREFIKALRDMPRNRAIFFLESLAAERRFVEKPMELLSESMSRLPNRRPKLPNDFTWIHSAVVTPTTIHFHTPNMEISNRVIRQFAEYHDRFLRVKFEEERPHGRLYSRPRDTRGRTTMDEIFRRVHDTLSNGIDIGDRHYDFLGFGNSQIREHGAYFFASNEHMSAAKIRAWMGDFSHIRSISKNAARIGQCFSTTRPVRGAVAIVHEIQDIYTEDRKFCFTDGVGIITRPMAQLSAMETGMATPRGESPSVIQFRAGGSKGVLAVKGNVGTSEENRRLSIFIRPSQYKFHARTERLEIIRWSQFSAAHLNRQIICVLSALGVADQVFVNLMKLQLENIDKSMYDETTAITTLRREVDANQTTLTIAAMVANGFMASKEPFVISLLQLWRAWTIRYLKKNAKIAVRAGAILLGCVDEYRVLEGHYNSDQSQRRDEDLPGRIRKLPEVFVQLSKGENGRPEVITKPMLLARNPSLHPGDVRVVQGVDRSELRHLKDCVVFPQTGDRDLPSMCSGGDLDGDDFLVIWDPSLLPPERNHEPMDFTPPPQPKLDRVVNIMDIIDFFVTYMQNDSLGVIANAHLAHADSSPTGVKDDKCLFLANLHSQAVDYVKNGRAVRMKPELAVRTFPHFMSFEKNRKTYRSRKVCGQLYDLVECVDFAPAVDAAFDTRILGKLPVTQIALAAATEIKSAYDKSLWRIMHQYAIKTEVEVWSAFVMQAASMGSSYKTGEVIGAVSAALKETYTEQCYAAAGSREDCDIVVFVAAMYEVTWNEVRQYNESASSDSSSLDGRPPLISFPWLFPKALGKIANGKSASAIIRAPMRMVCSDVRQETERSVSDGLKTSANSDPAAVEANSRPKSPLLETPPILFPPLAGQMTGHEQTPGGRDPLSVANEQAAPDETSNVCDENAMEAATMLTLEELDKMSLLERLAAL